MKVFTYESYYNGRFEFDIPIQIRFIAMLVGIGTMVNLIWESIIHIQAYCKLQTMSFMLMDNSVHVN